MTTEKTVASCTRDEFLRNLADSGLSDVAAQTESLSASDAAATGPDVARQLVDAGQLTAFQAGALLERRLNDLRIGNYDILARLGAGGMGTVFKARHRRMKRVVALKVLSKEFAADATFAQRFQREVETIAQLTHPNVVMAFDADEADGVPFLVMEFIAGQDLSSDVTQSGPLSVADAVDCVIQAARGLEYAHARRIVHRDVKPANLLRDQTGVVKVADLGLARLANAGGSGLVSSVTQAGGIVGTIDYMAPEQAVDSAAVDERVDIYSLGCTLYYLLTGRPPYTANSLMALLLKHREAPIPAISSDRADVPPELDGIFQHMAAKSPAQRMSSMTEVLQQLGSLSSARVLNAMRPALGATQISSLSATIAAVPDTETADAGVTGLFQPSAYEGSSSLTLVLVEPSRVQAGIIRRFLAELGVVSVHSAGTGREAIELARRHGADAVIAAMHLPDMTGTDLASSIFSDPKCKQTGFILATSASDSHEIAAPANPRMALVVKPFNLDRLRDSFAAVGVKLGGEVN